MKNFQIETPASAITGKCPSCGGGVRETRKTFSCTKNGCDFVIWKKIAGKIISPTMAANLLKYKKTGPFKGFVSKTKKNFLHPLSFTNLKENGLSPLILIQIKRKIRLTTKTKMTYPIQRKPIQYLKHLYAPCVEV
ncbi:topoisomerase C-terminal repeat-containing protein [Desulfamplus magnetovallimortis]|nr:topoisomerase C-terminal repeat-containing protein [Desulfamplus magnetovallimortis]